jgi:hypothetical protein
METPKFLRKYKLVFKVIKYVIGFIAMMYLISMCTYLISSESTFCCIMGMLILATIAVLVVTLISENINKLKSLFK